MDYDNGQTAGSPTWWADLKYESRYWIRAYFGEVAALALLVTVAGGILATFRIGREGGNHNLGEIITGGVTVYLIALALAILLGALGRFILIRFVERLITVKEAKTSIRDIDRHLDTTAAEELWSMGTSRKRAQVVLAAAQSHRTLRKTSRRLEAKIACIEEHMLDTYAAAATSYPEIEQSVPLTADAKLEPVIWSIPDLSDGRGDDPQLRHFLPGWLSLLEDDVPMTGDVLNTDLGLFGRYPIERTRVVVTPVWKYQLAVSRFGCRSQVIPFRREIDDVHIETIRTLFDPLGHGPYQDLAEAVRAARTV